MLFQAGVKLLARMSFSVCPGPKRRQVVPLGAPKHSLRDLGPEGQTFFDCKHKQLLQMFLNVKRLISRSGEPCGISSFFFFKLWFK